MFQLKAVDLVQQVTFKTQDSVVRVSASFLLDHGNSGIQDLYGLEPETKMLGSINLNCIGPFLPMPVLTMLKLSGLINGLPCKVQLQFNGNL